MSELRSALDGLLVVDDATLPDDQLVADLDEVERATRQLEVVRARRLAELERREVWGRNGTPVARVVARITSPGRAVDGSRSRADGSGVGGDASCR